MQSVGKATVAAAAMKDELETRGHFSRNSFHTKNGSALATYTWLPDCGVEDAVGCLFLFHGHRYHACFEYLEPNEKNERTEYAGSIPAKLNSLGLVVFAHDHPGHGRSSGVRGYWNSLDEPRDAALDFCRGTLSDEAYSSLAGKPCLVMAMSAGALVAIQIARKAPEIFTGYVLLAPAVSPPDNMFGLYGHCLKACSSVLDALVPKLPVLALPPSSDPKVRGAFDTDQLVCKTRIHVRVGKELSRKYDDVQAHAASIKFPAVLVIAGSKDAIVSPAGIRRFLENVDSDDKELGEFEHLAHEVIREEGCEEAREMAYNWIYYHI
jgi:acylglycerol lipase